MRFKKNLPVLFTWLRAVHVADKLPHAHAAFRSSGTQDSCAWIERYHADHVFAGRHVSTIFVEKHTIKNLDSFSKAQKQKKDFNEILKG